MRLGLLFVLLVSLLLLGSCKKYNAADPAFFMKANKISVKTTSAQGSGSNKITDLWLYVNGKFQGVYPVGNLMPIVTNNSSVKINIFPGIKNSGISDTRTSWPFYDFLTFDTLVESGKNIMRDFTFNYNASTTFTWTEDFDHSGFSIQKSAISSYSMGIAPAADSFEGKSGKMEIPASDPIYSIAQVESSVYYTLPQGSSNVYLELNYKCNQEFVVGLITEDGVLKEAVHVNPQVNWNKIYIQLSNAVSNVPVSNKYKVFFKTLKNDDSSSPNVFLDNIKLIYL